MFLKKGNFKAFMVFNITYPDNRTQYEMEKIVGPSFSFLERLKRRGVGSSKMQIVEASPSIVKFISRTNDTNYCNLEIREKGLVIGFRDVMKIYAWCIPYYQLNIYKTSGKISIYGPNGHIKAVPAFNGKMDLKFLKKVMEMKNQFDHLY